MTICGLETITGQMHPDFEIYPLNLPWRLATSIWRLPKRIEGALKSQMNSSWIARPVILLSVMHQVISPSTLIAEWLHNSLCPLFLSVNICVDAKVFVKAKSEYMVVLWSEELNSLNFCDLNRTIYCTMGTDITFLVWLSKIVPINPCVSMELMHTDMRIIFSDNI